MAPVQEQKYGLNIFLKNLQEEEDSSSLLDSKSSRLKIGIKRSAPEPMTSLQRQRSIVYPFP